MSDYLTAAQVEKLLAPINPGRVGQDGKKFSHVEAYEIRAHLNRSFGFARWSADVLGCDLLFESSAMLRRKDKKGEEYGDPYEAWTVAYMARLRLIICAPDGTELATYTEVATGDASNQPSRADAHDLAAKTAESQALKRAAANLGDQFGLSLYKKGSMAPLVGLTLVRPAVDGPVGLSPARSAGEGGGQGSPDLDAHITETPPENPEPAETRVESTPKPGSVAVTETGISDLRKQVLAIGDDMPKPKALKALMDVQLEASRAKLMQAEVENRFDERVTFAAFIESEIKRRQERAA